MHLVKDLVCCVPQALMAGPRPLLLSSDANRTSPSLPPSSAGEESGTMLPFRPSYSRGKVGWRRDNNGDSTATPHHQPCPLDRDREQNEPMHWLPNFAFPAARAAWRKFGEKERGKGRQFHGGSDASPGMIGRTAAILETSSAEPPAVFSRSRSPASNIIREFRHHAVFCLESFLRGERAPPTEAALAISPLLLPNYVISGDLEVADLTQIATYL